MRLPCVLATALILSSPVSAQDHGGGHAADAVRHGPACAYSGPNGPEDWGRLDAAFATCATGQQESPIDLSGAITADLGPLDLQWRRLPIRVFDTGHAIQVEASPGSNMTMGGKGYQLRQFHVHQPSEHLLNGHRFPLEIHFVHTAPDGTLGVIGVFAEPGSTNPALQAVLDATGGARGPTGRRTRPRWT